MADTPNQPIDPNSQPPVQPEVKPVTAETKPVEPAKVVEHPIGEDEAKKFAGQGDFSLPVSPLDQLVEADPKAAKPAEPEITYESLQPPVAQPQPQPLTPTKPDTAIPQKPAEPPTTIPTPPPPPKPDTAQPLPGNPKKLEDKAKDMLKELDKAAPPKRKRSGSLATKMALAALIVTVMGAGSYAGMQVFNRSSGTDDRSQAYVPCGDNGDCPSNYSCISGQCVANSNVDTCSRGTCVSNNRSCPSGQNRSGESCNSGWGECCVDKPVEQQPAATCASPNFCINADGYSSTDGTKNCARMDGVNSVLEAGTGKCCVVQSAYTCNDGKLCSSHCTTANIGDTTTKSYTCTDNGCTSSDLAKCQVYYYYSSDPSKTNVTVPNCKVAMTANGVETLVCAGTSATFDACKCGAHQIDVVCTDGSTDSRSKRWTAENSTCDECGGSTPTASYQCTSLTRNNTAPKIGQQVVFTCSATASNMTIHHYEFQYKIGSGAYQSLSASATGNTSAPLTINAIGQYTVQCRACKSAGSTECTTWGLAK